MNKKIIVTGGAGFIGSHACVELSSNGYDIIVIDNFYNSTKKNIEYLNLITGRKIHYECTDIRNQNAVRLLFEKFLPDSVMHFAGLKAVNESFLLPVDYYEINCAGTMNILKVMSEVGCNKIVFSSSATVYGNAEDAVFSEESQAHPVSPYGRSKLFAEAMIEDWVATDKNNRGIALRYFNPVGAHHTGLIGENPKNQPNNLMPIILNVANGLQQHLLVFGDDYPTRDGTGLRDYIHVCDLAKGHILALNKLSEFHGFEVINLGSGVGYTVKELVNTFQEVNDVKVPMKIVDRRSGDVAMSIADTGKAEEILGFQCSKTVHDICRDSWRWNSIQKSRNIS